MKIILSFFVATYCVLSQLFAQAPPIQWQNTIGGNHRDWPEAFKQTADGGCIIGGNSDSGISGDKTENNLNFSDDFWIVKLNATGAIQWQNTIGTDGSDNFSSMQQISDGGYIIGGDSYSGISGDKTENSLGGLDIWILKLDTSGVIQWQNTIGGDNDDAISSFQQTADGGYILGGSSRSNISGDKTENNLGMSFSFDYWVIKLDATGVIQWQNTIGGDEDDLLGYLQQTADGGYILGGSSDSNISDDKAENALGGYDFWVVKLDSTGAIQWQNTIGGNNNDLFSSIQETADGGYILGGTSESWISGDKTEKSMGNDYWILKLDVEGAIQWQNTIGGSDYEDLKSIQQTVDGGYILGGYSQSNISGDKTENSMAGDCWVLKLDAIGNVQWQNTIGGNKVDGIIHLQQTIDYGYLLIAASQSDFSNDKTENSMGDFDFWVIKLAPETLPTGETPSTLGAVNIYPNPTTDVLTVRTEAATTLCLRNAFGQVLSAQIIQSQGKIDLSSCPNGIYFLTEMETGIVHKILKVK